MPLALPFYYTSHLLPVLTQSQTALFSDQWNNMHVDTLHLFTPLNPTCSYRCGWESTLPLRFLSLPATILSELWSHLWSALFWAVSPGPLWSVGFGSQLCGQVVWVWILTLPFTSFVSLANFPSFSVPLGLTDGRGEELGLSGQMGFLGAHFKGSEETTD